MSPTQAAPTADPASTDILAVANAPMVWIFAVAVFAVIFVQSAIYVRAARRTAPAIGMTRQDVNRAFRAGAVASVGPSLAVVLVAIALLALFGTPAVLVRIGLIGSAATETASAGIAANTMDATLGDHTYTQSVFLVAFIAMTLSGAMWMLATLILTPMLKRGGSKLEAVNPAAMAIIPTAALLGAFSMLTIAELGKSSAHLVVLLVSAGTMALCLLLAHQLRAHWLKEWALGVSILVALAAAYLVHSPVA